MSNSPSIFPELVWIIMTSCVSTNPCILLGIEFPIIRKNRHMRSSVYNLTFITCEMPSCSIQTLASPARYFEGGHARALWQECRSKRSSVLSCSSPHFTRSCQCGRSAVNNLWLWDAVSFHQRHVYLPFEIDVLAN